MPKVYVVEKGAHDYTRAEDYGQIVYMFDKEHTANVFAPDKLVREIKEKLLDSTPDDFLVLSGSMLPAALVFFEWLDRHGSCGILLYSFKNANYELRTIRGAQFDDTDAKGE